MREHLSIIEKVEDKDKKIIGCIVFDSITKTKRFIPKSDFKKYQYKNAKISKDFKILSETPIKVVREVNKINKTIRLFHGSHAGIRGQIDPSKSRLLCDFGQGFYAGDIPDQAKTLITEDKTGIFYELSIDMSGLKVYNFNNDVLWALYVGVSRGRIDSNKYPKLKNIVNKINSHDVVIGLIADDRMMYVYSEFLNGNITDKTLIECLKYVKLGNQYVFKTHTACSRIKIEKQYMLNSEEKAKLKHNKSKTLGNLPSIVNDIKKKYRRKGKFIDELLNNYK